jgi:hypothetical protein
MATPFSGATFNEPVVHGKNMYRNYLYRYGVGMMPSAEYFVFHDDFLSFMPTTSVTNGQPANTPTGWTNAVIDVGATVVVSSATSAPASATGALIFDSDAGSEGAAIYLPKGVLLTANKKFFMEIRAYVDAADDCDLQFGLSDLTATTNPEDLWTTAAANVVAFGVLDGDATAGILTDASNAGTAVSLGTKDLSSGTWHVLGIGYDGTAITGWVDGIQAVKTTTTIPTGVALAPFVGYRNGSAATNEGYVDYFRFAIQR